MNTLNVLLPPKASHPVRFRLQGSGGCFTWAWDHHDVIQVKAEYNGTKGCSDSAVVTSIAPYDGRKVTAVYATDSITGQVIRCEVFIDKISRVQIVHHSLKLDLDGLATLRIHAFDAEDNAFSSLTGIQFLWSVLPPISSTVISSHSLSHVPLKDTPLSDCGCLCGDIDTRIELEEKGLGSDLYVVRGISVGQERVSVNLFEPQLEDLGDEIVLTVAEPMSLEPHSPLYILVGTQVQYTLKTLRYKMPSDIRLPSPYHHWSVSNASVAEVDPSMGKVFSRNIGNTIVVVEDIRVKGHQQISSLFVTIPFTLQLHLAPLHFKGASQHAILKRETTLVSSDVPWYLVVGWDYVIQVLAFSLESGRKPLYLTKDNDLSLLFGEWPYWKAIPIPEDVRYEQGWQNGTLIKAVSEGTGKVVASLKYRKSLTDENPDEVLNVEQEVIVCSPVLISFQDKERRNVLHLPWNAKAVQDYQLKAEGGCGSKLSDYRWASSDVAVATVSSVGVVRVKGLGQAIIRVMASTNPMNSDEVVVQISIPSSIAKVEGLPVETEVGSHLLAAVALKNSEDLHYMKCESFSSLIQWRMFGGGSSFVQINDTKISGSFESVSQYFLSPSWAVVPSACAWTFFAALQPGRATVTALLAIDDSFKPASPVTSGKDLMVSWTIAAYVPLVVVQAGEGKSYGGYDCGVSQLDPSVSGHGSTQCQLHVLRLVPGSSMKLMLQGGPERWGQEVEFIERYDIISSVEEEEAAEHVHVSHLTSSGGRFYEITCASLGNYTLTFYRGNLVGEDHPTPALAAVNLSVICSLPSSVTLLCDETGNQLSRIKASAQAERDQNHLHNTPITVVNGRTLRIAAVALDATGSPFANASSLPLKWILSNCKGLAYWEGYDTSQTHIEGGQWEQKLVLSDTAGQCLVRASVVLLTEHHQFKIALQHAINEVLKQRANLLTDAVLLQLVASLRIEPKYLLLYNDFNAKASMTVLGGSSHIKAYSNDSKVAIVLEQIPMPYRIHLIVAARGLGAATIILQDVGLVAPASESALVHVAEVAWVRLLLPEEDNVQVGSLLTVKLQAGDSMGNIFNDSQLEFMDIRVHVKDDILELVPSEGIEKATGDRVLGPTFLIRGANVGLADLYVSVLPKFGHEILSELRKIEVYSPLSIHPEGLVLAPGARYTVWGHGGPSIGAAIHFSSSNETIASIETLSGMLEANSPGIVRIHAQIYTHSGTAICKATLDVRVHIPISMILNVRGGQLAIGRKVSIFPTGTQEDLFSFFELCTDYKWTVGDQQVLTLHSAHGFEDQCSSVHCEKDFGETALSPVSSRDGEMEAIDTGYSVVAIGRAAGKTDITVAFSCHFHSRFGHDSTHFYTASDTIRVIPDPPLALGMAATWLLSPNFKTSNILPQSSDSVGDATAPGKRNIVYSVLQESGRDGEGISVDGGHIKTSERNEIACVQARDRRTGRSEVAVCVRVAEVFQIMIGDVKSSFHVMDISVGASQSFPITLLDNVGIPFFEVSNTITLTTETNRIDVVSVKVFSEGENEDSINATILVQALRQGIALVRVSQLENPSGADYILIHVGASISPRNPVVPIGGRINFSITGKGPASNEHGHWLSSNLGVMQINQNTGEAIAVGTGASSVSFNSSHLTAYTTATVVQISSVSVEAPEGLLTNVHSPEDGYHFLVKFSDIQGQDVGLIARDHKISYNCRVDPSYIGLCLPWQDTDSDKFYCVLHPYPPERLFLNLQSLREEIGSHLKVGDLKGRLDLKIIAEVPGTPEAGSVLSSFVGGFKILDMSKEVVLTPTTNRTKLTVVGSVGAVEVSWTRTDALQVKRTTGDKDACGVGGHASYEVMVIDGEQPFVSRLDFVLPTTGQRQEMKVQYDLKQRGKGAFSQQIITAAIITMVLVVLPLIICARLFDFPRPFRARQNSIDKEPYTERLAYESPVNTRTSVPENGFETPQPLSLSRSPPQPYTEYVSNTIENTPYFRRGVRRFDPSRTY